MITIQRHAKLLSVNACILKGGGENVRHQELIKQMTLEEKAAFLTGKNEWASRGYEHLGIKSITFADGPSGVRRQRGEGDHLGLNPSVPATLSLIHI